MVRLDTDLLQTPAYTGGISGGSKNVCVRTVAVVGINRDGHRRGRGCMA